MSRQSEWYQKNKKKYNKKRKKDYTILENKLPKSILIKGFDEKLYAEFLKSLRETDQERMATNREFLEKAWRKFIEKHNKK